VTIIRQLRDYESNLGFQDMKAINSSLRPRESDLNQYSAYVGTKMLDHSRGNLKGI
jgi:hypothetical protein